MPYIYRVSRRNAEVTATPASTPVHEPADAAPEPDVPDVSYRDLQAQAKALDIPANQTRDELEAALKKAKADE